VRKRVLFVSPQFPQDFATSVYGAFQRMRMWLDAFPYLDADLEILFLPRAGVAAGPATASVVARGLREHWGIESNVVICEREPEDHPGGPFASLISSYLRPALSLSRHPQFRPYLGRRQKEAFAQCLARSPEIIFFHRLQAACPAMSFSLRGAKVFLDLDDVEHRRFAREVAQPPRLRLKPLLYAQLPALWWGERRAILRSNIAFVCSEIDRRYLWQVMRVRNVEVIPNAVPSIEEGSLAIERNVLFIGAYSYAPNVVAAEYLIRKVWPLLASLCPRARLLIAGPRSENLPSFKHPPSGVEFLGFVSDLDALYRRTRVVCCPIQSGGGTRIKILEAASHGVPVVSTPLGTEGIDLVPDTEVVVKEDSAGLAEACAALLDDRVRAQRIGAAARERVRALYGREAIGLKIRAVLAGEVAVDETKAATPNPRQCS
jgi:glycosyltransferase involved in cell wall biosynthesis